MRYLVSKGANVNASDQYGITPLLAATMEGHTDSVKFLLANKADTTVKGKETDQLATPPSVLSLNPSISLPLSLVHIYPYII